MRMCLYLLRFAAGLAVMLTALGAQAEKCNYFMQVPPGGACCFQFVIAGNQTCNLNTGSTATDGLVNPFAYNGGSSTVSVNYNPTSNTTTVTICGAPIQPGQTYHYPPGGTGGNGLPHIGLDGGSATMNVLSASWVSCASPMPSPTPTGTISLKPLPLESGEASMPSPGPGPSPTPVPVPSPIPVPTPTCASSGNTTVPAPPPNALPMLAVTTTQTPGTNQVFYTLYVNATDANGNVVGGWYQHPYTAGTTPVFQITNNTAGPITLGSVGFITNDSQRSLDTLNFGTLPPPGDAGSPFATPNQSLNGTVIKPGGSIAAPIE